MALTYTLADNPNYRFRLLILNKEYFIAFRWSERNLSWFYTISDENDNDLIEGRKVTPLLNMLQGLGVEHNLIIVSKSGSLEQPTYDNFPTQYVLVSFTKEEANDAL